MKLTKLTLLCLLFLLGASINANAQTWNAETGGSHGGGDWTISSNNPIGGFHSNINKFVVPSGYSVPIKEWGLKVRAQEIVVDGTLNADGKGAAGGAGGPLASAKTVGKSGYAGGNEYSGVGGFPGNNGNGPTGTYSNCTHDEDYGWFNCCCDYSMTYGYQGGYGGGGGGGGGSYSTSGCSGASGSQGSGGGGATGGTGGSGGAGGAFIAFDIPASIPYVFLGSGGAGGGGGGGSYSSARGAGPTGGSGGGKVMLQAMSSYSQTGAITANGASGSVGGDGCTYTAIDTGHACEGDQICYTYHYAGGKGGSSGAGSGGGIMVSAPTVSIPNGQKLKARGGNASDGTITGYGAGGAGRIKIYRNSSNTFTCGNNSSNCQNAYDLTGCGGGSTPLLYELPYVEFTAKKSSDNSDLSFIKFKVDNFQYALVNSADCLYSTTCKRIPMFTNESYNLYTEYYQFSEEGDVYSLDYWNPMSRSENVFDWTRDSSSLVTLYFKKVDHYEWTGIVSSDYNIKENWLMISENQPPAIPQTPPTGAIPVVIRPLTPNTCHITSNSYAYDLSLRRDATLDWDSASANLHITRNLNIQGRLQPSPAGLTVPNQVNVGESLMIEELGEAHFDNTDVTVGGNIYIGKSGTLEKSLNNPTSFTLTGSEDATIFNDGVTFLLPSLTIRKNLNAVVYLNSPLGALSSSGLAQFNIEELDVTYGILDLNGKNLTISNTVEVTEKGQILLSKSSGAPSSLRILGADPDSHVPLTLNTDNTSRETIKGTGGNIYIGPFPDDVTATIVPAGTAGVSVGGSSWLSLSDGSSIYLDNKTTESGWDFILANGSKLTISSGSVIQGDRKIVFQSPGMVTSAGGVFKSGAGVSSGGDFEYNGSSTKVNFDAATEFHVYGNYSQTGSFGGAGGQLTMYGSNSTINSDETFNSLSVRGKTTLLSAAKAARIPTFSTAVTVESSGELVIPAGGTLQVGNGATINVFGKFTAVGNSTSRATITHSATGAYYTMTFLTGGTLNAKYADFKYLGQAGIFVTNDATIDPTNKLDYCRFISYDTSSSYAMLTVDNSQQLTIDGARFISNNSIAVSGEMNVRKSANQGILFFKNEYCSSGETACSGKADIAGTTYEADMYNRIYWTLTTPAIGSIEVLDTPLNSGKGRIQMRIDPKNNPDEVLYCIKDSVTNKYVDENYMLSSSSCVWRNFDFWGGVDGFVLSTPDNSSFNFSVGAMQIIPLTPPENQEVWSSSTWATPLVKDRTSPSAPSAAVTPTLQEPTGDNKYLRLSWGTSTDNSGQVDYVVLRGIGQALGDPESNPPWGITPPANYRPINGEWDNFSENYTDHATWISEPEGYWARTSNSFSGNVPATNKEGLAYINISGNGSDRTDLSNGYILTTDIRKLSGNNGVELMFKFHDQYMRWVIGGEEGTSPLLYYYSKIYYGIAAGGSTNTYAKEYTLTAGNWHQAMIYVKGNVARGFIDGTELWELNTTSISGDAIANNKGFGFRLVSKTNPQSVRFDNFMIAPFLYNSSSPATSWDDDGSFDASIDLAGPLSPHFAPSNVQAASSSSFRITINQPLAPPNDTVFFDQGTPYFYYVMAVDQAGNISNYLGNPGFEGTNFSVWQGYGASDIITLAADTALEGTYSGSALLPGASTIAGMQNITLPSVPSWGAILRFSRFFAIQDFVSGSAFPAVIQLNYSGVNQYAYGSDFNVSNSDWQYTESYFNMTTLNPTSVSVYAKAGDSSNYRLRLDQNRFDVITAQKVTQGYGYTHIQELFEGENPCSQFTTLTRQASGVYEDSYFLAANTLRSYRWRSCDTREASPDGNCGPWRGGYSCNTLSDCPAGKNFVECKSFEGISYCVRDDRCLPGVEKFTLAAVPPKPTLSKVSESESQKLRLIWDNGVTKQNRVGTEFLVRGWSSDEYGKCGDTGSTSLGYLNATSTGFTNTYSEDLWSITRDRTISGLNTNTWYCFRVEARNGDDIATGDLNGAGNWVGWSELCTPRQPPAIPEIEAGSFALAYGVGTPEQKRAMIVDGTSYQQVTFNLIDANNHAAGSPAYYNDIRKIWIRIAPHADFMNAPTMQRGYFKAEHSGDNNWNFFLEDPNDYGNDRVTLLTSACGVDPVGADLHVTFSWILKKTPSAYAYKADQDQGLSIQIEDSDGIRSGWSQNAFGSCSQVFHTSYLTEAPSLVAPVNQTWTNANSVNFEMQSPVDEDVVNKNDLYSFCTSKGICAAWGLTADDYNCMDERPVTDTVSYYFTLTKNIDCSGPVVAPTTPQWEEVPVVGSVYRLLKTINTSESALPDEGRYYWCVRSKDQHVYGTEDTPETPSAEVGPNQTFMVGIDRTAPTLYDINAITCEGAPIQSGHWQFEQSLKFTWAPANADPTALGPSRVSPLTRYYYILLEGDESVRINPYGNPSASIIDHVDGQSSYEVSRCGLGAIAYGQWQFGLQVVDKAGNVSLPQWFDLRIDRRDVQMPCIYSETHPDQDEIYCNLTGGDQDEDIQMLLEAPYPIFKIIDPVIGNEVEYKAHCGDVDVSRFAHSKMRSYNFTLLETQTSTLDVYPEDTNSPGKITSCPPPPSSDPCIVVCPSDKPNCADTQQPGTDWNRQFHFDFDTSSESDNIYHTIKYSLYYDRLQQSGSFWFSIRGQTEAQWEATGLGLITDAAGYKVNLCACDKDEGAGCKDAQRITNEENPFGNMTLISGNSVGDSSTSISSGSGLESSRSGHVAPFYIDNREVSIKDYEACAKQSVCAALPPQPQLPSRRLNDVQSGDYPVTNISWDMAQTFCSWKDKRLPSEAEWREAALTVLADNDIEPGTILTNEQNRRYEPVSVFESAGPRELSKQKVLNLLNNVSEWASDWWTTEGLVSNLDDTFAKNLCQSECLGLTDHLIAKEKIYSLDGKEFVRLAGTKKISTGEKTRCQSECNRKVYLGGSYKQRYLSTEQREALEPSESLEDLGFRCAKDVIIERPKVLETQNLNDMRVGR